MPPKYSKLLPKLQVLDLAKASDETHEYTVIQDGRLYQAVQDSARLAVDILNNSWGRVCLGAIGKTTLLDRKRQNLESALNEKRNDNILDWIDAFIDRLSHNFVDVRLKSSDMDDCDGRFDTQSWVHGGKDPIVTWQPKKAGTMDLDRFVCSNQTVPGNHMRSDANRARWQQMVDAMVRAGKDNSSHAKRTYDQFMFYIAVTMATELVPCFVGFLTGSIASGRDYVNEWYFVRQMFSGYVVRNKHRLSKDPFHHHQVGEFWLAGKNKVPYAAILPDCIQVIVDRRQGKFE